MEKEESNLYSRYQQDADAGKNGYYDYEWWLENKLTEAESELKKLRLADVSNSVCPNCGKRGYKTDLTDNSYACKKCLTWWANGC